MACGLRDPHLPNAFNGVSRSCLRTARTRTLLLKALVDDGDHPLDRISTCDRCISRLLHLEQVEDHVVLEWLKQSAEFGSRGVSLLLGDLAAGWPFDHLRTPRAADYARELRKRNGTGHDARADAHAY
jgi:hypothetical protein